jgi:Lon protease-like protein
MPAIIPLFPLNTILLPGGVLALRIFERRYVDMVRRSLREDSGFGIVSIREGREAGAAAAKPYNYGTYARIVDFDQLQGGLLGVTGRGERRFRIVSTNTQSDGLMMGAVEWLPDEISIALPEEYQFLQRVLRQLLPQLGTAGRHLEQNFDDAAWTTGRAVELLPVPLDVKQQFLEMDDPLERLRALKPLVYSVAAEGNS